MQKLGAVRRALDAGELDIVLSRLKYGGNGRDKVANVLEGFARSFDVDEERPVVLCSAPGRTEICGNHTDHQRGRVLAGAVDLDFLACASPNLSLIHISHALHLGHRAGPAGARGAPGHEHRLPERA